MTLAQLVTAPGQWLRADAAASWDRVAREVQRLHGWLPKITDSARPIEVQERIFLERYEPRASGAGPYGDVRSWKGVRYVRVRGAAAAVPGTSWHGPGLAVDVSELGGFAGTKYRQLVAVMTRHGWTNAAGRTINEPWHQQYYPGLDQHAAASGGGGSTITPPTSEEDDMPLNEADIRAIWAYKNTAVNGNTDTYGLLTGVAKELAPITRGGERVAFRQELVNTGTLVRRLVGDIWGHKPTGVSTVASLLTAIKQRTVDGHAGTKPLPEVEALRAEMNAGFAELRKTIEGKK